jgi:putative flippase GtrA
MSTTRIARTDQADARANKGRVVRYLLVGASSFVLDLGVLVLLREVVQAPLWLATSVAFWGSLAYNFTLQRSLTFSASGAMHRHLFRYAALLVLNYVATVGIVVAAQRGGIGYATGKIIATGLLTLTTYVAYREWVFRSENA